MEVDRSAPGSYLWH